MKSMMPKPRWQITSSITLCTMIVSLLTPLMSEPTHPDWWTDRGVKNGNEAQNLAVANIGQLKHIANQAHAALEGIAPDGSARPFTAPDLPVSSWYETQKKALNLGQLKAVAKPLYDRLNGISPDWVKTQLEINGLTENITYFQASNGHYYPWNPSTPVAENYKVATVGQLKLVYALSFNVSNDGDDIADLAQLALAVDIDGDGLPDIYEWWIIHSNPNDALNTLADVLPGDDFDNDGTTNADEVAAGTDPMDPSSGNAEDYGILNPSFSEPVNGQAVITFNVTGIANLDEAKLWEQSSIKGWSAVEEDHIETHKINTQYFAELPAHEKAENEPVSRGIKQTFKMLPGTSLSYIVWTIGRTSSNGEGDNDYIIEIDGASSEIAQDYAPAVDGQNKFRVLKITVAASVENPSAAIDVTIKIKSAGDKRVGTRVSLLPVEIKEVSFGGDKNHTLRDDELQLPDYYSKPHWVDKNGDGKPIDKANGERDYPVAYTRNSVPKIGVKFRIKGLPADLPVKLRVEGSDDIELPETDAQIVGNDVILPLTASSTHWPNVIKFYNRKDDDKAFKLDWEIKIGNSDFYNVATTKHQVYVTLNDPIKTLQQETLFYLSTKNADGLASSSGNQEVLDAIWTDFSEHEVKRVSNSTPMTYYKVWETDCKSTKELLKEGDGQCGAWAELFVDVLKTHGIDYPNELISITSPFDASGFLVKEWNFGNTQSSGQSDFPYLNVADTTVWINDNRYQWVSAEVTDKEGIKGQGGVVNPKSLFSSHFVLKINGVFYDPSYGQKYGNSLLLENAFEAVYDGSYTDTVPQLLNIVIKKKTPNTSELSYEARDL